MKRDKGSKQFAPPSAPDGRDRFFLAPRLVLFAGTAVWLFTTSKQMVFLEGEDARLISGVVPLLVMFAVYTGMFHILARLYPSRGRGVYFVSTVVDVAFIALLIRATGSCQSNFYLAYYPFIALAVFYFGVAGGGVVAALSSASYLVIYLANPQQLFAADFALRLGFMFMVFFVLAFLEENARKARADIERQKNTIDALNARLEERFMDVVEDKENLSRLVEEKERLLNSQNLLTARRRAHISFAKELSAQNDIAKTAMLFNRYSKGLLEADRADIVIVNFATKTAALYPDDSEDRPSEIPIDHPLILKAEREADSSGFFEATWNSSEAADIPCSILVAPTQPSAMYVQTLSGAGEKFTGLFIASCYDDYVFDPDILDELRILCNHLAVAVENMSLRKKLQDMADTDGLTAVFNHRYFQSALEREIIRCRRYKRPLALLMIDIDHFKKLNDSYGHQTGDIVLRGMCDIVKKQLRSSDILCRYGGEEFGIVMPETDASGAMVVAERVRRAVENQPFVSIDGETLNITVSLGLGALPPAEDAEAIVKIADEALYRAKESGRNRVAC
jgi:diguanylate cyclase (GGDEF)-like protein